MANFNKLNQRCKREFPDLDIEIVRGEGYIYFAGKEGETISSIYIHPASVDTDQAWENIKEYIKPVKILRGGSDALLSYTSRF